MTLDQIAKWKAEEQRQTTILYEAIDNCVNETSKKFEVPLLNALAGAAVAYSAFIIMNAPAGKPRKQLREMMDRALVRRLRDGVDNPRHHAQTIDMSKTHDH